MITAWLLKFLKPKISEPFHAEEYALVAYAAPRPDPMWVNVLGIVIFATLIFVAATMARDCQDKGLNCAVILIDPFAYIVARLFFGRC